MIHETRPSNTIDLLKKQKLSWRRQEDGSGDLPPLNHPFYKRFMADREKERCVVKLHFVLHKHKDHYQKKLLGYSETNTKSISKADRKIKKHEKDPSEVFKRYYDLHRCVQIENPLITDL